MPALAPADADRPLTFLVLAADPKRARPLAEMVAAAWPGAECHSGVPSSRRARALLDAHPPVVLLDAEALTGAALAGRVRGIHAQAPGAAIIVVAGAATEGGAETVLAAGAHECVAGDTLDAGLLSRTVRRALARVRAAAPREGDSVFRALFEQSLDAIFLTAPDGQVLAANPAACQTFGYSEAEFRALGRAAVVDPADPRVAAAIEERARTGRFSGELTLLRKGGGRIPVEMSSQVFRDSGGQALTSMFTRDITRRKEAEEALAASEKRYRGLVQGLHDGVFVCDAGERILEATARMGELTGYRPEALCAMNVSDLVDPADLAAAPLRRDALARAGTLVTRRRLRRRDGTPIIVEVASVLLGDGRVECVVRDITERERLDDERILLDAAGQVFASSLEHREMLRGLAELTVPGLADWCVIDVLTEAGEPELVEVGVADPELGAVVGAILERYPHSRSPERHPVGRVLQTGEPVLMPRLAPEQLHESAADPHHLALMRRLDPGTSMVAPLVAHGRVLGAIALTRRSGGRAYDRRDLALAVELGRRAGLAVEKARLHERLTQAVKAREQVLGYVAHDLRNPVAGIALNAGLLLDDIVPDELRRRCLESILGATDQLDRLIQDLLDVGSIEGGRLRVSPEPCAVIPLVREALSHLGAAAQRAGVRLEMAVPAGMPRVQADRTRFVQVISNLVGNALRFTPEGGSVTVDARTGGAEMLFSVTDTGVGIAAAELERLFDPIWQAQRRARGGTGLGLAITRGIVEAHGGRIWAWSEPGRGSIFFFTLPLAAGEGRPATADPAPAAAEMDAPVTEAPATEVVRVLLVDDHATMRRGLREVLAAAGPRFAVVGEAATGEDAVRMAGELQPAIVVMDLNLPGISGVEATRRIRAAHPEVRVLALTADARESTLGGVLEAGGSGVVRKSAAHHDLLGALETVAGGRLFVDVSASHLPLATPAAPPAAPPADPFSGLSAQERSVALLAAQGFTSREIAARLSLSPRTVDGHRVRAMKKLGLEHRAGLVRLALRSGLLLPG